MKAFELSRVFLHVWTVNLKFLPEEVFQSKQVMLFANFVYMDCSSKVQRGPEMRCLAPAQPSSSPAWTGATNACALAPASVVSADRHLHH